MVIGMETQNSEIVDIDVKELFFILLHKLWLMLIVGVLFATCAGMISIYLLQPMYTSSTKMYIVNRQEEKGLTLSDLETGKQLTKDYMFLVKSSPVLDQVISELKLNITSDALKNLIAVSTPEDTRILEISVTCSEPTLAKDLVDNIARVSSERMVSVMEMDKVNVVEEGNLPVSPTSPNLYKNVSLGGLLGIVFTAAFIILGHLQNDSIRCSEDIEKYLGITTLSNIPLEEPGSRKKDRVKKSKMKQSKRKSALAS